MSLTAASPALDLAFALLRRLSDGQPRKRATLAGDLRVPPQAIADALQALEEFGIQLDDEDDALRLPAPIEWLDAATLASHLGEHAPHLHLHLVDSSPSTNTTVLEWATAGAPTGTVLAAELQTAGRGRRGRVFHTGVGGWLTFSLLWRFEQPVGALSGLGPAVGVALARALHGLGVDARLKWPNDVLINHQKVSGVLTEMQGSAQGPSTAVIGIGINYRMDTRTRALIDQAVSDLVSVGLTASRNRVLAAVLSELAIMLRAFATQGFAPLRAEWDRWDIYAGRRVAVRLGDGSVEEGDMAGVSEAGALLVRTAAGLRQFHSGEVSLRPAAPVADGA